MKSSTRIIPALICVLILPAAASAQMLTALEAAEKGVQSLLEVVSANKQFLQTDRERYFGEIERVLEGFVDFEAVAAVVMNRFEGSASAAQKTRFADILKSTLTRFYGASLATYGGEKLEFLPPSGNETDPRADTVIAMVLRGADSDLHVRYQMFLNENDEWKLKNLNLAGINLGRQYFIQFSALMDQHDNDVDAVLDNWQ